jgi:Cu(I)/Ag(I) efflux system membrane fusion protein
MVWMQKLADIKKGLKTVIEAADINKAREGFLVLSDTLTSAVKTFGSSGKQTIIKFHCPMAFGGRGADWLQNKSGVENPYYGAVMFKCGNQVEVISPAPMNKTEGPHGNEH